MKNTEIYKENTQTTYSPAPRDCTALSTDPVIITEALYIFFARRFLMIHIIILGGCSTMDTTKITYVLYI